MILQPIKEVSIKLINRIWNKVEKTDTCWWWIGAKGSNGYGNINLNGKTYQITRLIYEIYKGVIPNKHQICHTCDNPTCVNPDHLFIGTALENQRDCTQKKRRGDVTPNVLRGRYLEVKKLYIEEKLTMAQIAKIMNVTKPSIWYIINKKFFKTDFFDVMDC